MLNPFLFNNCGADEAKTIKIAPKPAGHELICFAVNKDRQILVIIKTSIFVG